MATEVKDGSEDRDGTGPLSVRLGPSATDACRVMLVKDSDGISVVSVRDSGGEMEVIATLDSLEQAISYLESTQQLESAEQSEAVRERIQLLLVTIENPDEAITAFLQRVRSLPQRPFIAVNGSAAMNLSPDTADASFVSDDTSDPLSVIRSFSSEAKQHCSRREGQRIEIAEPLITAKYSPLPALQLDGFDPERDDYNLLTAEKIRGVHWIASIDFDGTVYKPDQEGSIILIDFARFLIERHANDFSRGNGNPDALDELTTYGRKWEDQQKQASQRRRVVDPISYPDFIMDSGSLSAAAFEGMYYQALLEYGEEFVTKYLRGEIYPYFPAVVQKIKDHGVLPSLTTGAPDFLLPFLLKVAGMTHGNGMTYEIKNGRLTGKLKANMGLPEVKARLSQKITQRKGYAVVLAIGNGLGDMGHGKCAVSRGLTKWDVNGSFVLVNGSDETVEEVKRHYSNETKGSDKLERVQDARVQVVDRDLPASNVVAAVGLALRAVFSPLHLYRELKESPSRLAELGEYLTGLGRMSEAGRTIENIENIKRIRDVLELEGLSKEGIRAELLRFYPLIIVEAALKTHMINTRIPEDVTGWLARIGASREAIAEVMGKNTSYHIRNSSLAPARRRPSSAPPPDDDLPSNPGDESPRSSRRPPLSNPGHREGEVD